MKRVLMIGDVCGNPGLSITEKVLGLLVNEYDVIIANCENSASDNIGATQESVESMLSYGVDVLTSGNHWFHSQGVWYIHENYPLIRPHNFGSYSPGVSTIEFNGIQVMNLVGSLSMPTLCWSIFEAVDQMLEQLDPTKPIIVDFHAQMPYEKLVLANYLDGKVNAVVGTHTHVATADHVILPKGTAYVTDLGMCGAIDSILGCAVEPAIQNIQEGAFEIVPPAEDGPLRFNAVTVELDGLNTTLIARTDFILESGVLMRDVSGYTPV